MFTHDRWTRASRRREERPTHHARVPDECIYGWVRWLLAAAMFAVSHTAQAHGIVGNRVFPGTLAFDDPAVMDELVFPAVSSLKHPREGADVTDDRIGGSFTRLLTSTLSFGIESGWIHRNWGVAQRSGFDTTALTFKDLLYKNETHEVMISAGLAWGIGHSGAQGVGANKPDTIVPSIFFGKGFGDMPDQERRLGLILSKRVRAGSAVTAARCRAPCQGPTTLSALGMVCAALRGCRRPQSPARTPAPSPGYCTRAADWCAGMPEGTKNALAANNKCKVSANGYRGDCQAQVMALKWRSVRSHRQPPNAGWKGRGLWTPSSGDRGHS
jgi:hypothetical protein